MSQYILNSKFLFRLFLLIGFLFVACTSPRNEKPIALPEESIDIDVGKVIRSGEFVESQEIEQLLQNNCDGKSPITFSIVRERTLEQSVDLTLQGQISGELEIAGKPLGTGASGKIIAAIGVAYEQGRSEAISDSGGMAFTIEAGDYPVYSIVWREKWEKGYIIVEHDGEIRTNSISIPNNCTT